MSRVSLTISGNLLDNANNQKLLNERAAFDIIQELEKTIVTLKEFVKDCSVSHVESRYKYRAKKLLSEVGSES